MSAPVANYACTGKEKMHPDELCFAQMMITQYFDMLKDVGSSNR